MLLSELPIDLLEFVAKKITNIDDLNKYRQLSSIIYNIVESIKHYDIELKIINKIYRFIPNIADQFKVHVYEVYVVKNNNEFSNVYSICCLCINYLYFNQSFNNLVELDIHYCYNIGVLEYTTKLEVLKLNNCTSINLSIIKYCNNLKKIYIVHCVSITNLSYISQCTKLEKIVISKCYIVDISSLQYCPNLKYISLNDCKNITDISPLSYCSKLEYLYLLGCYKVFDLSSIANCPKLKELHTDNRNIEIGTLNTRLLILH